MTGSGNMKCRVTLQRATVERNAFNEEIESWGTLAMVWAERRDVSAAESFRAQEVGAELTARFVIRHSATVATLNARDRLLYASRAYNITGVREKYMNRWLEVDCVARDDVAAVDESSP